MNSKYIDTAILSISSNNINKCKDITEMFVKTGILCSVSSNDSVINNNGKYIIEKGCNITFTDIDLDDTEDKIWLPLKTKYNLGCAHFHVIGKFRGLCLTINFMSKCNVIELML